MNIKRNSMLVGFLVLSLVGCGESLGGQRFVSLDSSDWIEFTSNSRLETTVDSSVIEGEYRIENDGRLRMSFDYMGGNYVIYGTFNDANQPR